MQALLGLVIVVLVIALFRGGRLERLAQTPFRHGYLVVLSLVLQVVIFSSWWSTLGGEPWIPFLHVFSLIALTIWCGLNFRLPGMIFIGLGLVLNLAAIASNGGHMPASPAALQRAGLEYRLTDPELATETKSTIATHDTRLYYLTDIFAVPKEFPLSRVFSIGDVLIGLGAIYFLQRVLTDESLDPPRAGS